MIGGWRDFYRTKQGGDGNKYVELKNYPGRKVWMAKPVEASGDTHKGEHFSNIDYYKKIVLLDNDQIARNLAGKLLVYFIVALIIQNVKMLSRPNQPVPSAPLVAP